VRRGTGLFYTEGFGGRQKGKWLAVLIVLAIIGIVLLAGAVGS
jgi:hypothetical protein